MAHRNARLTPTGRLQRVRLVVAEGKTFEVKSFDFGSALAGGKR